MMKGVVFSSSQLYYFISFTKVEKKRRLRLLSLNIFFTLTYVQEYFGPERKGRISLDVDIEGPVLLIPKHTFSPDLMVGDIGHVKVTNSTRSAVFLRILLIGKE